MKVLLVLSSIIIFASALFAETFVDVDNVPEDKAVVIFYLKNLKVPVQAINLVFDNKLGRAQFHDRAILQKKWYAPILLSPGSIPVRIMYTAISGADFYQTINIECEAGKKYFVEIDIDFNGVQAQTIDNETALNDIAGFKLGVMVQKGHGVKVTTAPWEF